MASYFLYKFFLYKKEEETFTQTVEKKLKVGNEKIKILERQHHQELQKIRPVPCQDERTHWLISRDEQAPELKE